MSEKGKTNLEHFLTTLSKVDDSKQEYLLGLVDGMALMTDGKEESNQQPKQTKQV